MANSKSSSSSFLGAVEPLLQFFIGICGALAIIGVFFKIQGYQHTELLMTLGFMGEAAAFIIMGSFALVAYFFSSGTSAPADAAPAGEGVVVQQQGQAVSSQEMHATAREVMEERFRDDLEGVMGTLAEETRRFGEQMREMSDEMEHTRSALGQMHEALGTAADGRLAEQAHLLGDRMEQMNTQIQQSGEHIEEGQNALERMHAGLRRAAEGALPEDAERLEEGMKTLGAEVHAMSNEMGPARTAVERMREELEQVTSGHLAENAERLGSGMNDLGGEMEGAGQAVERLRADLDEMASRFHRFNIPAGGDSASGRPPTPARRESNNSAAQEA